MAMYSVLHYVYSGTTDGVSVKAPASSPIDVVELLCSFEQWSSETFPVDDKNWSGHFEFGRATSVGTGSSLTPVQFDNSDPGSNAVINEGASDPYTMGIINVKAGDTKKVKFPQPVHLHPGDIFAVYVTPAPASSFEYTFKTTIFYTEN